MGFDRSAGRSGRAKRARRARSGSDESIPLSPPDTNTGPSRARFCIYQTGVRTVDINNGVRPIGWPIGTREARPQGEERQRRVHPSLSARYKHGPLAGPFLYLSDGGSNRRYKQWGSTDRLADRDARSAPAGRGAAATSPSLSLRQIQTRAPRGPVFVSIRRGFEPSI